MNAGYQAGWSRRERFRPRLTSLEEATARAKATEDPAKHALIFADVADNPGGGGRGNTMFILQAFLDFVEHPAVQAVTVPAPAPAAPAATN